MKRLELDNGYINFADLCVVPDERVGDCDKYSIEYYHTFIRLLNGVLKELKADLDSPIGLHVSSWVRNSGPHRMGRSLDISRLVVNDKDCFFYNDKEAFNHVIDAVYKTIMSDNTMKNKISQIINYNSIFDRRIPSCLKDNGFQNYSSIYSKGKKFSSLYDLCSTHNDHMHITLSRQ